ncbi:hypothetical protein [Streptomyces parvulus]|uniref:hypothetical protein n=1 Tax=Streptomyces parvulus TaxID=146923 RepID=UPI0015F0F393|nr:hypothetical protein [Streptomyces parvulus]
MSDPADVDGAEQAGSCCAAITELRRAAQRTEQDPQADDSEDLTASSSGPARDA